MTATSEPVRTVERSAWPTRSAKSARFARPGDRDRGMPGATSCSSNALRSLMSRLFSTIPWTCSSSSRCVCWTSNLSQRPSWWRSEHSKVCASAPVADARGSGRAATVALVERASPNERALDLVDGVAEQPLDRRALVRDDAVCVEHGDQVARVRDERAEARLAPAAVALLGERRRVERERDLRGERTERVDRFDGSSLRRLDDDRALLLLRAARAGQRPWSTRSRGRARPRAARRSASRRRPAPAARPTPSSASVQVPAPFDATTSAPSSPHSTRRTFASGTDEALGGRDGLLVHACRGRPPRRATGRLRAALTSRRAARSSCRASPAHAGRRAGTGSPTTPMITSWSALPNSSTNRIVGRDQACHGEERRCAPASA